MANLSSSCSAKLSREAYVATTCEADVKRFCGNAISGGSYSRVAGSRLSPRSHALGKRAVHDIIEIGRRLIDECAPLQRPCGPVLRP
jgi:hypothetical protein